MTGAAPGRFLPDSLEGPKLWKKLPAVAERAGRGLLEPPAAGPLYYAIGDALSASCQPAHGREVTAMRSGCQPRDRVCPLFLKRKQERIVPLSKIAAAYLKDLQERLHCSNPTVPTRGCFFLVSNPDGGWIITVYGVVKKYALRAGMPKH